MSNRCDLLSFCNTIEESCFCTTKHWKAVGSKTLDTIDFHCLKEREEEKTIFEYFWVYYAFKILNARNGRFVGCIWLTACLCLSRCLSFFQMEWFVSFINQHVMAGGWCVWDYTTLSLPPWPYALNKHIYYLKSALVHLRQRGGQR